MCVVTQHLNPGLERCAHGRVIAGIQISRDTHARAIGALHKIDQNSPVPLGDHGG